MTRVAVLGAGAGGLSTLVQLSQAGHQVTLWARRQGTLGPYPGGVVRHRGALGEGQVKAALASTDLAGVLEGAEAVIVSLPAPAHGPLFAELAELAPRTPLLLSPGQTGGALHFRNVYRRRGVPLPPVAELSTLPYVARARPAQGEVEITGVARHLRCGALPGGAEAAAAAAELLRADLEFTDVLASSLSNVNLVLHPPGALLSAAWVEATGGDFNFYVDAMTPGVARVMEALDGERLEVAVRFGHNLPALVEEMASIGTVPEEAVRAGAGTALAVRSGEANRAIKAPPSLRHRYYIEDFGYGLVPFVALARTTGTATPVAEGLAAVGAALLGAQEAAQALGAERLGIAGLGVEDVLQLVREQPAVAERATAVDGAGRRRP